MKADAQECQIQFDENEMYYGRGKVMHGRQPYHMMEMMEHQLG